MQLIDQDVELLQMLINHRRINLFLTSSIPLQLLCDISKALAEYASVQIEIETGCDQGHQIQGAI